MIFFRWRRHINWHGWTVVILLLVHRYLSCQPSAQDRTLPWYFLATCTLGHCHLKGSDDCGTYLWHFTKELREYKRKWPIIVILNKLTNYTESFLRNKIVKEFWRMKYTSKGIALPCCMAWTKINWKLTSSFLFVFFDMWPETGISTVYVHVQFEIWIERRVTISTWNGHGKSHISCGPKHLHGYHIK